MITDYVVNGIERHELVSDSTLHVVAVVSNPVRYHSRYRLFREFAERIRATANAKLHVVELAFGDRHFECTGREKGASELQLRTRAELWHKENMINLGVRHLLPRDWKYLAWVDADIKFDQPNWALETLHQLQHYKVVQPWSECIDTGAHGEAMQMFPSFCKIVQSGIRPQATSDQPYKFGHSGFAWACTRGFWENIGGLMDKAILGSADHHMAWGIYGDVEESIHGQVSEPFRRYCHEWQTPAHRETHGHVGHVPGIIHHHWHGPKAQRRYRERWQILIEHGYNPYTDLRYDSQGLVQLVGKPHLENAIRRYFRERNEDSI